MRLLKLVAFLLVIGSVSLVGYAYFGNLAPEQSPVSDPVDLDAG